MTEIAKIENVLINSFYRFTLKYKWKTYKNLSVDINNYKWKPKINWINYDYALEKLREFQDIEKKLFNIIKKRVKKQLKENNFTITIKDFITNKK